MIDALENAFSRPQLVRHVDMSATATFTGRKFHFFLERPAIATTDLRGAVFIEAPGHESKLSNPDEASQQEMLDQFASQVAMGRVGDPGEIAKAAVFLASDDASFITNVELFVDGGLRQI